MGLRKMMRNISSEELEELLSKKHYNEVKRCLREKVNILAIKNKHIITRAILPTLQVASAPIGVWCAVTSYLDLGVASFFVASFFLSLTVLIAGACFYFTHKKTKSRINEALQACNLSYLKLLVYEEMLKRSLFSNNERFNFSNLNNISSKTIPHSKVSSLFVGMMTAMTIFASYYIGTSALIHSIGFVSVAIVLASPLCMLVAAIAAIGIGIILGYKHYHAKKFSMELSSLRQSLTDRLHIAEGHLYGLKEREAIVTREAKEGKTQMRNPHLFFNPAIVRQEKHTCQMDFSYVKLA